MPAAARSSKQPLLGIQAALAHRFDEARQWWDSALAVDPGFYDAWVARGFNRMLSGDTAGARGDAIVAARLPSGSHLSDETLLVLLEARAGRVALARRRLGQIVRGPDLSRPGPLQGSLVAWALFAVGEQDQGMSLLERVQPRGASLWFWLRSPGFDPCARCPDSGGSLRNRAVDLRSSHRSQIRIMSNPSKAILGLGAVAVEEFLLASVARLSA